MPLEQGGKGIYTSRPGEKGLKSILSSSREETIRLGVRIGKAARGGEVIAMRGTLGAGKTTLAKGIAKGLDILDEVTSPTYTIISEYSGRLIFRHMDAYRLANDEDFAETGGRDLLENPDSLCLVEWSERLPETFGSGSEIIEIEILDDGSRRLLISGPWLEGIFT